MSKKSKITFSVIGLLVFAFIVILFQKKQIRKGKITSLYSQIDDLEDELEESKEKISELEDKISELEESLSEVEHFDNTGTIGDGYSSNSSGTISYTGNVLKTKIDGEFQGWDGETIFKMMNGTIWQQASYDYTYHYSYMPDVIIYRKGGFYYMKVEDMDDEIMVRQIK